MTSCGRLAAGTARVVVSALFGAAMAVTAAVSPAAAHTALKASSPTEGARVDAPLEEITLEFTESVRSAATRVVVRGPEGGAFESGPPQVTSATVVQPLGPLGAAGTYQITYRVVSVDGHPVTGTIRFTLTDTGLDAATGPFEPSAATGSGPPAGAVAEPAANAAEDGDGVPPWALAIGAVAVVAAVTGSVWFGRRATRDPE